MENNTYKNIREWHKLLEQGIITEKEFTERKTELLINGESNETAITKEEVTSLQIVDEQFQNRIKDEPFLWFRQNKLWILSFLGLALIGSTIVFMSKEKDIDEVSMDYINDLSQSKVQIITETECNDSQENINYYDTEIYRYSLIGDGINKIHSDINDDGIEDYVVYYTAGNCWQGNGMQNYLSNMFIVTSDNNSLIVNEDLTNDFKTKFIDLVNENLGTSGFEKVEKEQFINGLDYQSLDDKILKGTFNITTENCQSEHPCYTGLFEYNLENKSLELTNVKNID